MSFSRGSRTLLVDVAGWAFACVMGVVALVYSSELKAFAYKAMGVTPLSLQAGAGPTSQAVKPRHEKAASDRRSGDSKVELRAGANGHFFAEAEANGRRINVMVDTGASIIALTYEDAETIGIAPAPRDFTHQVSTANGVSRVAPVVLDRVQIGDILVRNVQAVIAERGKLNVTLLGNSFLSRLSYRMTQGRLILED